MNQKELEYYLSQVRRIAEHREKTAMIKIRKTFKALLKDLQHFIADEYNKYAEDDELTFEMLNRKRQYARFIEEAVKVVDEYYPDALKETTKAVEQTYQLTYDGMVDGAEKSNTTAELKETFKGVKAATPQQIKASVINPINGITLPATYAKDKANYIYDLKRELNIGLLNGDRYATMSKRIVNRTNVAYSRAERIVRTETHRVREQGFNDSATEINETLDNGSTSMRMVQTWCTMEDERVRGRKKGQKANHVKMDGVSVLVGEEFDLGHGIKAKYPSGSGDAANDINCRCFLKYELKDMTGKVTAKPKTEIIKSTNNVENQLPNEENSGIIKEDSKKPITPITDAAIGKVPYVKIKGYTDSQCAEIQKQHKELLKYSRDNNDNKEVSFVFNDIYETPKRYKGSDDSLILGNSLYGKDLIILHNHPRNSSYSFSDLLTFISEDNIKTMTIVKNNGTVECLTKVNEFNKLDLLRELKRAQNKNIKSQSKGSYRDSEYRKIVNKFLNHHAGEGGVFEWLK